MNTKCVQSSCLEAHPRERWLLGTPLPGSIPSPSTEEQRQREQGGTETSEQELVVLRTPYLDKQLAGCFSCSPLCSGCV